LWLDSDNRNSRITANVFADVLTVSAAIHMEMNREANQIDDNIIWDVRNAEPGTGGQRGAGGSGIFLHASEHQIVAQNLIGRCDNVGVFPALRPERARAGNGRDHIIRNNIIAQCAKGGIVFVDERNEADGNVYSGLPEKFAGLGTGESIQWLDLAQWRAHGWDGSARLTHVELSFDPDRLELTMHSQVPLGKLPMFNGIDRDLAGKTAGARRAPGPLAQSQTPRVRNVDPRASEPGH
ncbi:MAG TPA: right-handed parallel beta-helix repeat-containing protein, partial [Steroidobacteraceae bacterium]